jgi:hypothetical protein
MNPITLPTGKKIIFDQDCTTEELTNSEKIDQQETQNQPITLPTSYIMFLTMRSQFIDELAKTDLEILHKWKEYEDKVFMELEAKQNQLNNE